MIKIWGRNTSSNVQKAMWAIGELGLAHERIDIGGNYGMNKEPKYLAMNPNGLVPTLEEEDGFLLWESNSVVRYLAGKHDKIRRARAEGRESTRARQPVDGLAIVGGRSRHHARVLGLDPHAGRQARHGRDQGVAKTHHRSDGRCSTRNSARRPSSPARHSPMATFRSASCATATASLCRAVRRRRTSTAGTTRSHRARRSRITSAAFR